MEILRYKSIAILTDESKNLVYKRRITPLIDVGTKLNIEFVLYENVVNVKEIDVLIVQSIPKSLKTLGKITSGSHILVYDIPDYMGVILNNTFLNRLLNCAKRVLKSIITFKIHPYIILRILVKKVDLVVTGSHLQADFFRKDFNKLAVDLVDPVSKLEYYGQKIVHSKKYKVKIVWDGTEPSFLHFYSIINALKRVSKTHDFELIIFTDEFKNKESKTLFEKLSEVIEVRHIYWSQELFNEVLLSADIAIAPIDSSNIFNYTKPANKIISYWAFGLPVICSDIPSYRRISTKDRCFCCKDEVEWIDSLRLLITDHKLRKKMGDLGYDAAWSDYTNEHFARKYLQHLNEFFSA